MGYDPMESVTNFVSCDIKHPATDIVKRMRERNVRISTVGGSDFENFIRLSMGTPEDTDAFLKNLQQVIDDL